MGIPFRGRRVIRGCGRTSAPGLELRCGYSEHDLFRSERVADIDAARSLAEQWKGAVLAKGGFKEMATP